MTTAIIQVRLNSKRLPKKALLSICENSLLENLVFRLKKSKYINKVIISTSNNKTDKKIIEFCKKNKILFYKGSLKNVFLRIVNTTKKFKIKYFLRVCADSPLLDSTIIDKGIKKFNNGNYDLVTNRFPRSYPKGQTVEIIKTKALSKIHQKNLSILQKEHFTKYFYDNPMNFKIYNFKYNKDLSDISMAIDNKANLNFLKKINKRYNNKINSLSFKKLLKVYEKKNV